MKTMKVTIAVSLMLIFAGIISTFAGSIDPLNKSGVIITNNRVAYVVHIDNTNDPLGYTCPFYVVITDEHGKAVVPAQQFHLGIWSYAFTEIGPVAGARIARMVRDQHAVCPNANVFLPSSQLGPFEPGKTYSYILTPYKLPVPSEIVGN
jgi:hypothetical protein